jgi:hypothetical protein
MTRIALKGLTTGLILQIAIGPIFFLIVNITLQKTLLNGLFAVVAVTIVDYLYIALAIAGIATPVFLSISIVLVTLLKSSISPLVVQFGNRAVGLLLIVYGITRLIKNVKPKFRRNNS